MARTVTVSRSRRDVQVLTALASCVAALGAVKYLALAVEGGLAQSPWGFALIFVLPFVGGAALIQFYRRTGAAVIGLFAAGLAVVCGLAVAQGLSLSDYWPDLLMILVGGPMAVAAVALSIRVVAGRGARSISA